MKNKREGLYMFLSNVKFKKLSVLLVITFLVTMLMSVSLVNATEAVSAPVTEYVFSQGLGDEVFNNDDVITILFNEPLQNDKKQATAAIQKAVDDAFGSNKATVETYPDEDGKMNVFFAISPNEDINLSAAHSIVIKAKSIVGEKSQKQNPVDLIIYTPAPSQNAPEDEPYILNIGNNGLWDGIMNKNDHYEEYDGIWFDFNQPLQNVEGTVTAIQSLVDAAFGPGKTEVYDLPFYYSEDETEYTGFVIEALEDIDLSKVKSIVLPPNTVTAQNGISNTRNLYIYIQSQVQTLPQPQPQPEPQPQPQPQPQVQPARPSYPGVLVKYGSNGDTVKLIQDRLNNLGYNCGAVDGIFGPKTKSAVIKFQSANGLAQDGIVGPLTWGKLFGNTVSANPISSSDGYSGLVKYGMQGELVKKVQSKLLSVGFNPGPIDGIFGPKTLSAVKAYQKAKGLSVDGIVGPITWKALFG